MLTLYFIGAVVSAVCVAAVAKRKQPKGLPAAGPPPEDRGEAVRRVLKHLQRKSIGEIREGEAAVMVGTVLAIDGIQPLAAPISGRPCLGYHLDIRLGILDERMRFRQLHEEARCTSFRVVDDTGASITVDADGLELAITDTPATLWPPPHPPALTQRIGYLVRLPITVEEGLLHPGMRVLVCGVVSRELAASDYRDGAPQLILRASATFPLVASTDADLFAEANRPIAPEELHRR